MSELPRRAARTDTEKQLTVEKRLNRGNYGGRSERVAPVRPPATRGTSSPAPATGDGIIYEVNSTGVPPEISAVDGATHLWLDKTDTY